jgi:hypothetical protein
MAIIVSDKGTLITSSAGMRLIALQTLFNWGDFERLRAYIAEHFAESAIEAQSADSRLAALQTALEQSGKVRVYHAGTKRRVTVHD